MCRGMAGVRTVGEVAWDGVRQGKAGCGRKAAVGLGEAGQGRLCSYPWGPHRTPCASMEHTQYTCAWRMGFTQYLYKEKPVLTCCA